MIRLCGRLDYWMRRGQGTEKFQDIRRIIWSYFATAKIYNRSGIGGTLSLIVSARGTVIQTSLIEAYVNHIKEETSSAKQSL